MTLDTCERTEQQMKAEPQPLEEIFAKIAARAATLSERLAGDNLIATPAEPNCIQQRLHRFHEQVAKGDRALFEEILSLQGHEPEAVKRAMTPVRLADPTQLPDWIEPLRKGLRESELCGAGRVHDFLVESEPMPFEQLLAPFVSAAVALLRGKAGDAYALLDRKSHVLIERMLLNWLTNVCGAALMLEFSVFRLKRQSEPAAQNPVGLHDGFVKRMLQGGLTAFFAEYSVLARASATLMKHWSDAIAEFLIRLEADSVLLSEMFLGGRALGSVLDVQVGLSDPHHCARTVLAVKFSSGIKVVYKPKSVETEAAYGDLLEWLSSQGLSLQLNAPTVLSRPAYGWIGYIDHSTCDSDEQLKQYYTRAGMLLAVYHILETTDIHDDNLIAAGEHPMLIDAETLITPPLHLTDPHEQDGWAETAAIRKLESSITKSVMLPFWRVDRAGNSVDMSGLGSTGGEDVEAPVWQGTQTDAVSQQVAKCKTRRNRNVPFPENTLAQPARFLDEIEKGFREAYQHLLDKRAALLSPGSPLERLARAPMRLVFRDTRIYFSLLKQSLEPNVAREGVDRSIQLSALNRILCISQPRSRHLPLVNAEQMSLEQLDIPVFTFFPKTCALNSGTDCIDPEYFSTPGYARVREKIMRLSSADCEEQCEFIRSAFYAKMLNQPQAIPVHVEPPSIPEREPKHPEANFLDAAIAIAKNLGQRAVRGSDGSYTWIALSYVPRVRSYRVTPIGPGLFGGSAGIALFLAGLEKLAGKQEGLPSAQDALMPVRRFLTVVLAQNAWRRENTGEMEAGLLIYPLLLLGQLLGDSSLLELARSTANILTGKLFEQDGYLDAHNGTAGVLLGLLALQNFDRSVEIMPLAIKAGECLLKSAERQISGKLFALNRLYTLTGDSRFQPSTADELPSSELWFKGPAAAGLATLAELELDITRGEKADGPVDRGQADSLYEGLFGTVDLQIETALRFGRQDYLTMARANASRAISLAQGRGRYKLYRDLPSRAYSPGFYQGESGIGYELLRLCKPGALPSVLLWNLQTAEPQAQAGVR